MAIHSSPYPAEGIYACPTIYDAQRIVNIAAALERSAVLGDLLPDLRRSDDGDDTLPYYFRSGVGVTRLRQRIGRLWERLQPRTREAFLRGQVQAALAYLEQCRELLERHQSQHGTLAADLLPLTLESPPPPPEPPPPPPPGPPPCTPLGPRRLRPDVRPPAPRTDAPPSLDT